MSHNIPKIVYGSLNTAIVFDYPPQFEPEKYAPVDHTSLSINGTRQTSVDRIEVLRSLTFEHLTEAQLTALRLFFTNHAYLGKAFKYFEDQNSIIYVNYELLPLKFEPQRYGIAGENIYFYSLTLNFRRVIGSESTIAMSINIANNQVAAADVTGVLFDKTTYISIKIYFELFRKTDSSQRVANGYLTATYHSDTDVWDVTPQGVYDGDAHGVTFSMSGQQLQYVSDNMSGTNYSGTLKLITSVIS